jgi:hypothetical protein
MPLQATSGAASYDAFGGGVAAVPNYIEDVFSTWLYTGNASTQTITNGINLSDNGGLVWTKWRSGNYGSASHCLIDTVRGANVRLATNLTNEQISTATDLVTGFTSTGYTLGADTVTGSVNGSTSAIYASWTFRKQPKFFDVVAYTGDGDTSRLLSHSLGSVPGMIVVKCTSSSTEGVLTADWWVAHIDGSTVRRGFLNKTDSMSAAGTVADVASSTTFSPYRVGWTFNSTGPSVSGNTNGATYVAYLFAHNAGGFGLTGTDNVISCGSFTTDGSGNATVDLGYEPQWVMIKSSSSASSWQMFDSMRGWVVNAGASDDAQLRANLSNAESLVQGGNPTSTGFYYEGGGPSATFIYIAIRRGPMKVPTTGVSVFQPYSGDDSVSQNVGYPTDMYFDNNRAGDGGNTLTGSRLIGNTKTLSTASTAAETTIYGPSGSFASNTNFAPTMIGSGSVWYSFRRAPGFFDVVCDTGTNNTKTVAHNLTVAPELIIRKTRSASGENWKVGTLYDIYGGFSGGFYLNTTNAFVDSAGLWNNTQPTSSVFTVSTGLGNNDSGVTYVNYLFATCPGVSKVGSYTGNGTSQTINCGFTGGARFVLIKNASESDNWYVFDTARGIVSGADPYIRLNSTLAEASEDFIDPNASGFAVEGNDPGSNRSGNQYIFLAIA